MFRACSHQFGLQLQRHMALTLLRAGWPSLDARLLLFLFVLFFFSCCLFVPSPAASASDALFPGQSLSGNQTLVSKGGLFEAGFFRPGESPNYYIGIWYKKSPSNSPRTVVWVANRERPVSEASSSQLSLSGDGNLVLIDHRQRASKIWSSNLSTPATNSTVAVLLDTGNLVLQAGDRSGSSAVIWQSFDHLTDTWLPGARVGRSSATGEYITLTSWRTPDDPSPGAYSCGLDPDGSDQLVQMWNRSERYWSSGLWNGWYFDAVPELTRNYVFNYTYFQREKYFTYSLFDTRIITRFMVDISGEGIQWAWLNNSADWMLVWSQPRLRCDIYSLCGAFTVCSDGGWPLCACLDGFQPASLMEWEREQYWASGCVRRTSLQCNASMDGEKDRFRRLDGVRWAKENQTLAVGSMVECEEACLRDCACSAYAYGEGITGCYVWKGNLLNLRSSIDVARGTTGAADLYLRLAASEFKTSKSDKGLVAGIAVGAVLGMLLLFFGIVLLVIRRRRRSGLARVSKAVMEGPLAVFKYRDLQTLTGNFTERLGGGSFGSVFKGMLPRWGSIAVKKLQGLRQGEKQFRAEVTTMGTVQHVNVVRLLGFCCEGDQRLLVYDYMEKGSLDSHLFKGGAETLSWKERYQIALGTARGLAYLHEECRDCIIHCDIKPENILLDGGLCAKVADFGMAKLMGREFSRVLTSMRGTIGYLAPEWLSGLPITPKADVYSYGMVLFEIVSGRRNNVAGGVRDGRVVFLPVRAAEVVAAGGDVVELLDERLGGEASREELERTCRVACWCIQDLESHRPSMGLVVQVLEGVLEMNTPPLPTSLQQLVGGPYDSSALWSHPLASDTA